MKKFAWIPALTFVLGILVAGFMFVYLPEKHTAAPASSATPALPSSGLVAAPLQAAAAPSAPQGNLDFVSISQKVGPAVVQIVVEKNAQAVGAAEPDQEIPFDDFFNRFFGNRPDSKAQPRQRRVVPAQGTGFFISPDGYILTNNHIAQDSVKFAITTSSRVTYDQVKVVGTDPRTDLALLKVDVKNVPYVMMGDSDRLQVGEWVLAIGNPYGFEHTVTAGIVSGKARDLRRVTGDLDAYEDFIQTDASINKGNSGGPLINMKGEVIGITSSIFTPTGGSIGIGFAISSNLARKVVDQLRERGRVVRGLLGVSVLPIDEGVQTQLKLKDRKGALVNQVTPDSPAEKVGFKPYDVIVSLDGTPIADGNDLRFKVADLKPGTVVKIQLIRDGKEMTLTPKIAELEPSEEKAAAPVSDKNVGLKLRALTPELARRFGTRITEGLLITEVDDLSEAARKGLQPGMVIVEVNRRKVADVREFDDILRKTPSGQNVLLMVRYDQDGQTSQIIVTLRVP